MRYYLIAGEASGDLHGGNLIRSLAAEDPAAEFRFWGGDQMAAACGHAPVVHYSECAVMGLGDILKKLGKLAGNVRRCKNDIAEWRPDVVIPIDYPGMNLRIAHFCHDSGFKVFYYIAPKTWASRPRRNRRIKAWVDRLFIVFPFEVPYFTKAGIPVTYKGNPLLDAIDAHRWMRPCEGEYVALLPGSRKSEISHTLPVCMEAFDRLGMDVVIAGAPSMHPSEYEPLIGGRKNVRLVFGRTYDVLKYARCAVVNSGTASLEAAIIGTPQVVCWSTDALTYFGMRRISKVQNHVKYISLGNLCLDRLAFRELIQDAFTPDAVCDEVRRLWLDEEYRAAMQNDYARIRETLGQPGASRDIARAMIEELQNPII